MAMPSSQSIRSESEMIPELRPVMPVDLFRAAMKGDSDLLIRRLGLQPAQTECQVIIETSHSASEEINTENQNVQSELQSATRFGDTILHLLVTEGHNELALMVFQRDISLLKAQNKMLETPLHCAAKVGNEKVINKFIQWDHVAVEEALGETNKIGDTALHVAADHGHIDIGCLFMKLDPQVAYKVNNENQSALYMAIIEGHTLMVQAMLEVDPTLASTQFFSGTFPVHEAARMDNLDLVTHFMQNYPDDAELRDHQGFNFFHIAADENAKNIFSGLFKGTGFKEMIERMNTATTHHGNTPFHITARAGHKSIMRAIWKHCQVAETVRNKKGLTPFQLSRRQVVENNEDIRDHTITSYINREGENFTLEWFDKVMDSPLKNKWEQAQAFGLGAVLITTVAFAAAFTIPGGYNQDNGTPVLGRRYMFRAFIIADTMAFVQGFICLSLLLSRADGPNRRNLNFAISAFQLAASSMVVAFGLGLYLTLSPVCYPIAVFVLVITLIVGSPTLDFVLVLGESYFGSEKASQTRTLMVCLLLIFCLGFM